MAGSLKEKILMESPDYLVFFDNVRVDNFVKNFSTQLSIDGGIGTATVDMIYVPDLYRVSSLGEDVSLGSESIKRSKYLSDGIENMTNLRIFVKNTFSGKYACVFDGNIKSKSLTKSGNNYRMTFSSTDYIAWLNKTILPLAIPMEDRLQFPERLKWKAQGIDINKVETVPLIRDINFRGKTLEEVWNDITYKTMTINKLYTKSDAVLWDKPLGRVVIMADIDPEYTKDQSAMDFIVTSSASFVNSIYVMMNDLVRTMMFEFFQDRDGVIRIKAPFWSEPILKKHVIDPALILNFSESMNWEAEYSRVIATGGLEWWEDYDEFTQGLMTPTSIYREDGISSDSRSKEAGGSVGGSDPGDTTGAITGSWLDAWHKKITSDYGKIRSIGTSPHQGVDYGMPNYTPVKHTGAPGVVSYVGREKGSGLVVKVRITHGSYQNCIVRYAHLSSTVAKVGQEVKEGTLIAKSGGGTGNKLNDGLSTGAHLHVDVKTAKGARINPHHYMKGSLNGTNDKSLPNNYAVPVGSDDLLEPSEYEKKYGPSIFNVSQPLIKFSGEGDHSTNRGTKYSVLTKYAAYMLHYMNSTVDIATLQTVAMPWIRPGFNVWVDPVGVNKVYYVTAVSFSGGADTGVYTNLGLTMGRELSEFTGSKLPIGKLEPGSNKNIFINQMKDGYIVSNEDFGKIVGKSKDDYTKFRDMVTKFHMNAGEEKDFIVSPLASKYYKGLYADGDTEGVSGKPVNNKQKDTSKPSGKSDKSSKGNDVKKESSEWRNIIRKGSSGNDVKQLQEQLKSLGYTEVGKADGKYGPNTEKAVKRFQREYGLQSDGIVGPKTKQKLSNPTGRKPEPNVRGGATGPIYTIN